MVAKDNSSVKDYIESLDQQPAKDAQILWKAENQAL